MRERLMPPSQQAQVTTDCVRGRVSAGLAQGDAGGKNPRATNEALLNRFGECASAPPASRIVGNPRWMPLDGRPPALKSYIADEVQQTRL
jgi:hypothetical protein